jgi:hypothetical protein
MSESEAIWAMLAPKIEKLEKQVVEMAAFILRLQRRYDAALSENEALKARLPGEAMKGEKAAKVS